MADLQWLHDSPAAAGPSDPVLRERAAAEFEQIEKVRSTLAARVAIVPWMPEEPRGAEGLRRVATGRSCQAQQAWMAAGR